MSLHEKRFFSLCYHYIRPKIELDPFPRLLGICTDEFINQIHTFKTNYNILELDDVRKFFYEKLPFKGTNTGLLITFDDGLSDHYTAAKILSENEIKGTFFIPTCILEDKLPANPIILHYALAKFGLTKVLEIYRLALKENHLDVQNFDVVFKQGDNAWTCISGLKNILKYKLQFNDSRKILLYIYKNLILEEIPNALEIMHLTNEQINEMLEMGHSIGTHSHSHISVGLKNLSSNEFFAEVIHPKKYLEKTFNVTVNSFSYPFGEKKDCLSSTELLDKTKDYELVFIVDSKQLNTKNTSPLEICRHSPMSTDTSETLDVILTKIGEKV